VRYSNKDILAASLQMLTNPADTESRIQKLEAIKYNLRLKPTS
jgi:hypothetical protein